jgi:hypothetical protein
MRQLQHVLVANAVRMPDVVLRAFLARKSVVTGYLQSLNACTISSVALRDRRFASPVCLDDEFFPRAPMVP